MWADFTIFGGWLFPINWSSEFGAKKKNCPWYGLYLTLYLTLYGFLHLHNFSHIVQDNAHLLTLKFKVFCDELLPTFLFSLFSYLIPFFGWYTPTITNNCYFPTRCTVSFPRPLFVFSLCPTHPILYLTNSQPCCPPGSFSHPLLPVWFTFLFLNSHNTHSKLIIPSLFHLYWTYPFKSISLTRIKATWGQGLTHLFL